jgi:hypothetical protein
MSSHFEVVISPKKYSDPLMLSKKLGLGCIELRALCITNVVYYSEIFTVLMKDMFV